MCPRRVTDAVLICSSPSMGVTCRPFKGQLAARHQLAHGAQRGLHHAAGHAEDVRRARGQAQRRVERPLRQRAQVDAGAT